MLSIALMAQIAVSIVTQGVPTLAPFLQADLNLTHAQVGLFNSALMIGSSLALFGAGWLVDFKGERLALQAGNLITGTCCLAVATTHTFYGALAVLVAVGVGAAFPTPAGSKAVMRWFPVHQRGMAMGIRQTGIPLGGALAAAILPLIAIGYGWRWAVAAGGLGCLLSALITALGYRVEDAVAPRPKGARNVRRPRIVNREILLLGLAGALLPLGQFGLVTYLAICLRETHGIPVTFTATLLVAAQIAGAAGRVLWGVFSDRFFARRRKPALMLANILAAFSAFTLAWLPLDAPRLVIGLVVLVFAFNTIGWHGVWISMVAEIAGTENQGRTIAAAMTLMYPGIIVLPPLFGLLVDHTHSWPWAWTALGGALLTGTWLVYRVQEAPRASTV